MPAIQIGPETLDLPGDSQVVLERNNPLLQEAGERGEKSLAINAPRTPRNDRLLGYPARFDHLQGRPTRFAAELLDDIGGGGTTGTLVLRSVTPTAYVLNFEYGATDVMQRLKSRKLSSFHFGGLRRMVPATPHPTEPHSGVANTARYMRETTLAFPAADFVFAPVSNNDANGEWDNYVEATGNLITAVGADRPEPIHSVNFNAWGEYFTGGENGGFAYTISWGVFGPVRPATISPLPLIRLEYLVREIFRELHLPLVEDFFQDSETRLLVLVPNNAVMQLDFTHFTQGGTGLEDWVMSFLIADHLPDITAQEFIRILMDTFGLHFDVSLTGECRLLRSARLFQSVDLLDLTQRTGPAFSIEMEPSVAIIAKNRLADGDRFAEQWGQQPEAEAIVQEPVNTKADLPPPIAVDVFILVTSENRYYQTVQKTNASVEPPVSTFSWVPGPAYLPAVTVGQEEEQEEYEVGMSYTLARPLQYLFNSGYADVETLTMLEPGYNPGYAGASRSQNLRLAFYRGVRAVPGASYTDGSPALVPWLTMGNTGPDGVVIGQMSLQVAGGRGLVSQFLKPLLALQRARGTARFPSFLNFQEFQRLDTSQPITIRGDQFMLRRATIGLPLRKPGTLELIPRFDIEE